MGNGPLPARVAIVEVGPRDGLQNESATIPTDLKRRFIEALVAAGHKRIEATAFVHPKCVPQMADADALFAALPSPAPPGVRFSALVPNRRGLARALDAGAREIAVVASATDTFNRKNLNAGADETLQEIEEIGREAGRAAVPMRAYLSVTFVCPYEGPVPVERVVSIAQRLSAAGAYEIALSDTIGAATPADVERVLEKALRHLPAGRLALHLHDTRGTALPNVLRALEMGIVVFDAAAGGLGGCPYAPGAAGNLATEDLVYMLNGMGIETEIDLSRLIAASSLLSEALGRPLPSRVFQAGGAPRPRG